MKKTISILTGAALLLTAVSCDMDLVPKGSIVYQEGDEIITTQADLNGFEANIMYWLRALEYGEFDYTSDIMMDYFNATVNYGNNVGGVHRTDNSFTSGDYYVEDNWYYPYNAIKSVNIFLDGSTNVPDGITGVQTARGEAYFLRAFCYLHLARHFGKAYNSSTAETDPCVPLVIKYDITARPARASVQEIYDQIKADLDSAAVLLADVKNEIGAQRPTPDAVDCMYARYYLDTRDWANAASKAVGVINSDAHYALSSTEEEMEQEWVNDNGSEPIVQYFANISEGSGGHTTYFYVYAGDDYDMYVNEYFAPTKTLVESYDENDLRFKQWFSNELPAYHNNWFNERTGANTNMGDYYYFQKYYGNPDLMTRLLPTSAQKVKPFLISEMYLIAAEAYFNSGNTTSAGTYLGGLQTARGASTTSVTLDNIKTEWYRETVGEGLRMTCLKRWGDGWEGRPYQEGLAYGVMTGTYYEEKTFPSDDYHFQWPVPLYEIQTNLNLVQNPGYSDTEEE